MNALEHNGAMLVSCPRLDRVDLILTVSAMVTGTLLYGTLVCTDYKLYNAYQTTDCAMPVFPKFSMMYNQLAIHIMTLCVISRILHHEVLSSDTIH